MPKLRLLAAFALLPLAGCHHAHHSDIAYTLEPNAAEHSIHITCDDSTSGKCHFAFAGDTRPSNVIIEVGSKVTVGDIPIGSPYCAENRAVTLGSCAQMSVPSKKDKVIKKTESDSEGS